MMWHGRVRTELMKLSAAPLNLGSGFSRETPALDSFLLHSQIFTVENDKTHFYIQWKHWSNVIHSALNTCIYNELNLMGIELQ